MARQRGPHQLSGKINNLCYYEQKGVRGGLVRRINEGMSERVKSGAEYVRTRHANSYFGGCSIFAGVLLNMLGQRSKYLFKFDRQALLTKGIYELNVGNGYDQNKTRIMGEEDLYHDMPYVFDRIVKNKISDFFSGISQNYIEVGLGYTYSLYIYADDLENYCQINNCVGVAVSIVGPCYIYGMNRPGTTSKFNAPQSGFQVSRNVQTWSTGSSDMELFFNSGDVDDAFTFVFLTIQPVIQFVGERALTKNTGAVCGMIQFKAT